MANRWCRPTAAPGRTPSGGQPRQDAGYPEGRSPKGAAPKASAAQAHSRARQDAKRREYTDAKRLTEKEPDSLLLRCPAERLALRIG